MKKTILAILISATLTGCVAPKAFKSGDAANQLIKSTQLTTDNSFSEQASTAAWWNQINDPALQSLVEKALKANWNIRTASARLEGAMASSQRVALDQDVSQSTSGSVARIKSPSAPSGYDDQIGLNYQITWQADFWNKLSAGEAIAQAHSMVALYTLEDVQGIAVANVAKQYIAYKGMQERIRIANGNVNNQKETVRLSQLLLEAGISSELDVVRAKAQLEQTKASLATLTYQLNSVERSLEILTGTLPGELQAYLIGSTGIPNLPKVINIGNVSELLSNRPDIRIAEARLKAQYANYNITVADQYPSITFAGSVGYSSTNLADLSLNALTGSIGPSIQWRGLNQSQIKTELKQKDALIKEASIGFDQAMHAAVSDIQNGLDNFKSQQERRVHLAKTAKLSQKAALMAKERYKLGTDAFIDVLQAEATRLAAEDALAQSNITTAQSVIQIYEALGNSIQ